MRRAKEPSLYYMLGKIVQQTTTIYRYKSAGQHYNN